MTRNYTHPSVLDGIAAGEPWADPTMDPSTIDWDARLKTAAIPFAVAPAPARRGAGPMIGSCTCCRVLDAVPGSPWCDHCLANAIDPDGQDPALDLVPDEPWQPVDAGG